MRTHAVASFRKLTPGMLASQRLAMANDIVETTKAEVALALKKSAPALGIDGTTYHVLDILIGLTKADDWKTDRRPLVAISNEKLAEYVCRSKRTVVRCLKKLVEAGVLAYRDSSTGRRFIYRNDTTGEIDRGYGLDFSPARQRVAELKRIAAEFAARLKAEQEAKRSVNRLSRAIQDMLDLGVGDANLAIEFAQSLAEAMSRPCHVLERAEILQSLYEQLLEALATDGSDGIFKEMPPEGDITVTPYNNTNPQNSIDSKKRTSAHADDIETNASGDNAPEKEQISKLRAASRSPLKEGSAVGFTGVSQQGELNPQLSAVSIGLVELATANLQETLGVKFTSWARLVASAEQTCLLVGLSLSGWNSAVSRVGDKMAATVLAVTAEKALRDPEAISSPGGYFRACIDRAIDGKLLLHKSLYGLAES
ncbi:plasmid replication protein RepC [Pseudovibrio exalbescens]|uniref:plasmid replication protein RepC n=1 Tax=Pseudovibrio exalbescens TaxID=197461 RepID=UPI002366151E|nr:plasmid replication protein RepC [Pseudovibrio exalbescens]MDD7911635.1 plasmid replication protein RepC [Pseudovibrio exalbescens]